MIGRRAFLSAATQTAVLGPAIAKDLGRAAPLPRGAASRFANVDGLRLHYVTTGTGPVVVLLHGWPQTWFAWASTMMRLATRFTLVAPDLRGIGLSDRPDTGYDKRTLAADIAGLIAQVAGGRAHVVGHDMGGKTAYMLAHLHPERIDRLVLVDCAVPGTENMDSRHGGSWHYGFHMAEGIPEMLTQGRERAYIAAQIRAWSHRKDAVAEATIDEFARHYATPGGMTAGFNLYRALREDAALAHELSGHRLEMPILAIGGEYGVGAKLADALRPVASRLTAMIAPGSGHFVPEEAPDFFCTEVTRFLTT